jgi:hypothetical protein
MTPYREVTVSIDSSELTAVMEAVSQQLEGVNAPMVQCALTGLLAVATKGELLPFRDLLKLTNEVATFIAAWSVSETKN